MGRKKKKSVQVKQAVGRSPFAYLSQFINQSTRVEHIIAGFLILMIACFVTLGFPGLINASHVNTWFFSYEYGYLNRGFMGSLFQLVHGSTTAEKIYKYLPLWDKVFLAVVVAIFWAMLVIPIWKGRFSYQSKWLFMAFVAVVIFSPIWKEVGSQVGQLDEYVLLWVLLAFLFFLGNKPVGFLCCIAPCFAVHPQGFIYALLMLGLVIHAILRSPRHAARWRAWVLVAFLSLCVPVLLGMLHSGERSLAFIEMNKEELLKMQTPDNYEYSKSDYGSADKSKFASSHLSFGFSIHSIIYSTWSYAVMLGIVGYALPIFAYVFLFAYALGKTAKANRTSYLSFNHPFLARLIACEHYIVMGGLALLVFPTLFLGDWGRVIYWSWFRVGIVSAYFLWFYSHNQATSTKREKNPKAKKQKKASKGKKYVDCLFAGIVGLWAYMFSGAPLVLGNIVDPTIYNCEKCGYFYPYLNSNPLGDLYSESLYRFLVMGNASDFHLDAQNIYVMNVYNFASYPFDLENDKLRIPEDFAGEIWGQFIKLPETGNIFVTVTHEGDAPDRLRFAVSNQELEPVSKSEGRIIWHLSGIPDMALVKFSLLADQGEEFAITGLEFDFEQ